MGLNTLDTVINKAKDLGWMIIEQPPEVQIPDASQRMARILKEIFGDKACLELRAPMRNEHGQVMMDDNGHTLTHNVYRKVVEWMMDNRHKGLLCYGSCGLGKTVLCGVVIPRVINEALGKVVNCYNSAELNKTYEDVMKRKYVMIDDVGQEAPGKSYGENLGYVFSQIVDNAERKGNLLILTTNLSLKQLSEKYGTRTVDRLKALTTQVYFEGTSKRR